jgi:uncharacterized membrane protein
MLKLQKGKHKTNEILLLSIFSLICLSFSIFRTVYTDTNVFLFLNWNLFLAFIPWALTTVAISVPKLQNNRVVVTVTLLIWVLFFPNALYILTDLFHLGLKSSMPVWFDLVLILTFSWTGLLYGFFSLWDIEILLRKKMNPNLVIIISIVFLFVASFGIYVGRYLRWNSWDIIKAPLELFCDISNEIVNPVENQRAWGMTLFMGIFLNMIYWTFKLIKRREL